MSSPGFDIFVDAASVGAALLVSSVELALGSSFSDERALRGFVLPTVLMFM